MSKADFYSRSQLGPKRMGSEVSHLNKRLFLKRSSVSCRANANRFSTLSKRQDHSEELDERLDKWTSKHTAEEVVALLQAAGVPAGTV